MKLEIVKFPDARITTPCDEAIPGEDLRQFARAMVETAKLQVDPEAAGLASNQVGGTIRLIVCRNGSEWIVMANPIIQKASAAKDSSIENCLSLPGVSVRVQRSKKVTVEYNDPYSSSFTAIRSTLRGFLARIAQHEIDHLDGILITHRKANR